MTDLQLFASLGGALLLLLGTIYTVRATKGKTRADYKSTFEKRIDDKMMAYTEGLEIRVARAEEKLARADTQVQVAKTAAEELKERVDHLEDMQEESSKREKVLYRYTARLRDHIIGGFQPPPPPIPDELLDWYENFEAGQGLA